jgi:hypothetical protein
MIDSGEPFPTVARLPEILARARKKPETATFACQNLELEASRDMIRASRLRKGSRPQSACQTLRLPGSVQWRE